MDLQLKLTRTICTPRSTIGPLTVNGSPYCYILERPLGVHKVAGDVAIDENTYEIKLEPSPKFGGRLMPHLQNVPGRTFVMLHPGNKPEDTRGCLMTGRTYGDDYIYQSRDAFEPLLALITATLNAGGRVFITIERAPTT